MISETPLYERVEVEALVAGQWTPLLADATGLRITRGGVRDGLGVKTDVGLCTFTLKNAQDPLDDGSLAPGMPVRVRAGRPVAWPGDLAYTQTFDGGSGTDNWTGTATATRSSIVGGAHSGFYGIYHNTPSTGSHSLSRTVSGLTVGAPYTLTAWVRRASSSESPTASVGVVGLGATTPVVASSSAWQQLSFDFVASSVTHTLSLYSAASTVSGTLFYWDDISLTRHPWTEDTRKPIFTGRVAFLGSTYPIDKARGTSTALTTVTVADAVAIHAATQRYGRIISAGFETFEDRIAAYAATANAPVIAPSVGAPREVYSF